LEILLDKFAFSSIRTKPSCVVHAEHAAHMPVPAGGAMTAESPVVPRAIFNLSLGINVQEGTFFVVASTCKQIKIVIF